MNTSNNIANISLNNLSDNIGARHKSKRIGRGIGSGKGKTSGRGVKGQKARSGVAIKNFEGGQMSLIKRLPKRGFTSITNPRECQPLNLGMFQRLCNVGKIVANDIINKAKLIQLGILKKSFSGTTKLLAAGELRTALSFDLDAYSEKSKEKVAACGGKIIT